MGASAVDTISTLNNCSASIGEGCTVPTLPVDNTTLASCETKFAAVTTKNKECYDLLTATSPDLSSACTCWAAAATLVTETKKENCTAKASFDMIKDAKKACLSKFTGCKKAEDASIGLIHVCNGKTTPAPITTTPAPTTTAAPATGASPSPNPTSGPNPGGPAETKTLTITQTWSQEQNGYERTAKLAIPETAAGEKVPVVFHLHGNGGQGNTNPFGGFLGDKCILVAPDG